MQYMRQQLSAAAAAMSAQQQQQQQQQRHVVQNVQVGMTTRKPSTETRNTNWVPGSGFRVSGFGFRVSGFGFRVSGVTKCSRVDYENCCGREGVGSCGAVRVCTARQSQSQTTHTRVCIRHKHTHTHTHTHEKQTVSPARKHAHTHTHTHTRPPSHVSLGRGSLAATAVALGRRCNRRNNSR
jgi:hypothetical protein